MFSTTLTTAIFSTCANTANKEKYPNQKVLIVKMNNYAYAVPFVEEGEVWFLKTIIPSRKETKKYLK